MHLFFFIGLHYSPIYWKGEVWNKNIQKGNMTKEKNNILNKVFAAVQTLGPSLTTGIAVIPLGGLLMGLASILTNATFTEMLPFLQNSVVIAIATLFQNIEVLLLIIWQLFLRISSYELLQKGCSCSI